jgi:hypothetical protein
MIELLQHQGWLGVLLAVAVLRSRGKTRLKAVENRDRNQKVASREANKPFAFAFVGIVVGAAVAGVVETHSAAISVASLVASGKLTAQEALIPILVALTSKALAKIAMAIGAGSAGFAMRVAPGIVLSMAAAWAVAIIVSRQIPGILALN